MKTSTIPVVIPLLNPNEPEARLVSINTHEGQLVFKGDVLCTLETTKATSDLVAEIDGYVTGLNYSVGDTVMAGGIFCYLAESLNAASQKSIKKLKASGEKTFPEAKPAEAMPPGLRITQPALILARQYQIDLNQLPTNTLITESLIKSFVGKSIQPATLIGEFDVTRIIVYGGGGHGKSLIELIRSLGDLQIIGIIDDRLVVGQSVLEIPVLGGEDVLSKVFEQGAHLAANAVGGIGNIQSRVDIFERLAKYGFHFPILIHPSAVVESSASLSPGVQIFPHAYVGSESYVGFGAIINTGAVISHDCRLGDYVNISPGALLAGGVIIGEKSLIGMGVTINLEVTIGAGVRIGNGTTVKADVPAGHILKAGSIWPE